MRSEIEPRGFTRNILLSSVGLLWMVLMAPGGLAQVSAPGWMPLPEKKAAEKRPQLPLAERAARGEAPLSRKYDRLKVEAARLHRLPPPDPRELRPREPKKKLRVGIIRPFPQPLDAVADSTAFEVAEGKLHVFRVASEGAVQLRLHFLQVSLPDGARLFVYPAKRPDEFVGPYQSKGPNGDGEFWTPPLNGDELVVEFTLPKDAGQTDGASPFRIVEISHIFKSPRELKESYNRAASTDAAGNCQQDVPAEWGEAARSVGLLQFTLPDGEYVCTGTLLNTTDNSGIPFVLTANHCIGNVQAARTVATHWLYDQATDNGLPPPGNTSYNGGLLLATGEASDFTLLRLNASRLPDGVRFSGWSTAPLTVGQQLTTIHHPSGDYKRIAFGSAVAANCPNGLPGGLCDNYLKVRWSVGATEPGSSGSGVWAGTPSDPKLVGTLTGGDSSCSHRSGTDYYGRFALTFQAVSYYLEGESKAYTISQSNHIAGATGGGGSVTVTALEGAGCNWATSSLAPWLTITSGGTGSGDGAVSYTVEANPGAARRIGMLMIAGHALIVTQAGAGETCPATPLNFSQTVSGNLSPGSCRSVTDETVYADRYTFTAAAGQQVAISLTPSGFASMLTLTGPKGEVVAQDGGGDNPASRIPAVKGALALLSGGTYTVEVSSAGSNQTGGYSLTLTAGCTFDVSSTRKVINAYGGRNFEAFDLKSAGHACFTDLPPAISNARWITDASSDGVGKVSFSAEEHKGDSPRTGVIYVAGVPLTVRQLPFCNSANRPTISPESASVSPYGGSATVNVRTQPGAQCTWFSTSEGGSWLSPPQISGDASNIGDATYTFLVSPNQTLHRRTAVISFVGQPFTITQETPVGDCRRAGITVGQTVEGTLSSSDCPGFTQGSFADLYTFTGAKGQQIALELKSQGYPVELRLYDQAGDPIATFRANPTPDQQRIPAGGYFELPYDGAYTVLASSSQAGATGNYTLKFLGVGGPGCSYSISPNFLRIPAAGGTGTFTLSVAGGCEWTAVSDVNWITFPGGAAGSGGGTIAFSASPNTGPERRGTITVANRFFGVVQDAPCGVVDVSPPGVIYAPSTGAFRSVSVTVGRGCPWEAVSRADWIRLNPPDRREDGGNQSFMIMTNGGPYRVGQVEVAGKVIEIRQGAGDLTTISSASYGQALAPGSLVSVFGQELAPRTEAATSLPLPTSLGGIRVTVVVLFYGGFNAPLLYVSPGQINFQIPENVPTGQGYVEIQSENGLLSRGYITVGKTAPGLFSADATGQGLPAAVALRVRADGSQQFEPVARFDVAQNKFIAAPIDLGDSSDQVFLILFGTGLRFRSALTAVTAQVGGESAEVLYAGAQGAFAGLDQVNVRLPRSLVGRGEVEVTLTVDGLSANAVRVSIN